MKTQNGISVQLCTADSPQCDVIRSSFVFPVSVALLLYRVHFLVLYVNGLQLTNYAEMNMIRYVNDRVRICV